MISKILFDFLNWETYGDMVCCNFHGAILVPVISTEFCVFRPQKVCDQISTLYKQCLRIRRTHGTLTVGYTNIGGMEPLGVVAVPGTGAKVVLLRRRIRKVY